MIKIIDALYKCNWMDVLPGHNIGDRAAGSSWEEMGPLRRVQAVLTDGAELGTEFVSRGSWCDGLQFRNNEWFNVAYLLRM